MARKSGNLAMALFGPVGMGAINADQTIQVGFGNLTPATFASFALHGRLAQL